MVLGFPESQKMKGGGRERRGREREPQLHCNLMLEVTFCYYYNTVFGKSGSLALALIQGEGDYTRT